MSILEYSNENFITGGGTFEIAPEGIHNALCIGVFDIGLQTNPKFNTTYPKIVIMFELDEELTKGEQKGKRFVVSLNVTKSLSDKATFRKHLNTWGVDLNATEFPKTFIDKETGEEKTATITKLAFDPDSLVGVPAMVTIAHSKSKDGTKTYANIINVSGLHKDMKPLEMENVNYEAPEWIQKKIAEQVTKESVSSKEVK